MRITSISFRILQDTESLYLGLSLKLDFDFPVTGVVMEKILQIIAEETHGKSYRTSRIELDAENLLAQIEYDISTEVVLKHRGKVIHQRNICRLKRNLRHFLEANKF